MGRVGMRVQRRNGDVRTSLDSCMAYGLSSVVPDYRELCEVHPNALTACMLLLHDTSLHLGV